jgi:hypothetical protein
VNDIHRRAFKLYLMEQDRLSLDPAQHAELDAHLSTCPACREDVKLYRGLRAQAGVRWLAAPPPEAAQRVLESLRRHTQLRHVTLPLRALTWTLVALLALLVVQWIFTSLRPTPAVLPFANPTPERATDTPTPTSTPSALGEITGKIPVISILGGESAGWGIWSPGADYFLIPLMEAPVPGSDRRSTRLHFVNTSTGEDCPASESFLGGQGYQNYAWLDNERVLYIDKNGRPLLFTACQEGFLDLSDRFDEPLSRIALPVNFPELTHQGPLLLEGPSAYWLLDPAALQAKRLADPCPSPDLADSFAWLPSGDQISVLQLIPGDSGTSRLVILDLNSGEVMRSLVIEASEEGRAPIVEWMGPEHPFAWGFGAGGPLLVDLSGDPPRQVHVLPELLGLDLAYPDQIFSMGAFYAPEDGDFHIVVHTNLPEDKSIFIYHSESGGVDQLDGDRRVILFLPGDQRMTLVPLEDTPTYDDGYDLVWVDKPGQPQVHIQVAGHTPRNYPNLASRLLPGGKRMLFGSTQGISLVGIPGGETLAFWQLVGAEDALLPTLSLAPDGRAFIAITNPNPTAEGQNQKNLLYWIPLEAGGIP